MLRIPVYFYSMDPSLTEKLKGAFKDSLAEIGRKLVLELHKLKQKNDSHKNQHKSGQASGSQGRTENQRKTGKAKTLQNKLSKVEKKAKGKICRPEKKKNATGKSINQTNNQQKIVKSNVPQSKSQKQSKMTVNIPETKSQKQSKMMPQSGPINQHTSCISQRNRNNQHNMVNVVQIRPTNNQNMALSSIPLCS